MYDVDFSSLDVASPLYQQLTQRLQHYQTHSPIQLIIKDQKLTAVSHQKKIHLSLDFVRGSFAYRLNHASLRKEAIAKAVGIRAKTTLNVIDATAGLCRDSLILAALGCQVIALERDPLVFSIVEDALKRSRLSTKQPWLQRLHYQLNSSIEYLQTQSTPVDVIYLDPMFPEKQKSAKVKQEMLFLQWLFGPDLDSHQLLNNACQFPCQRIVVKRPIHAPTLTSKAPDFAIQAKKFRFDVYLPR